MSGIWDNNTPWNTTGNRSPGSRYGKFFGAIDPITSWDPGYQLGKSMGLFGNKPDPNANYASNQMAAMTRDMWQQWVTQFMPVENTLIDYASNVQLPNTNAVAAVKGVQGAFQQGAMSSDLARKTSGIQLNPDEQKALARDRSLSQSLAEVQAGNTARTMTVDRQRGILGAPVNTGDLSLTGGR